MSFTVDIIDELASSEYEKTCCKKALLCGIFFAGDRLSKKESSVELKTEGSASCAVTILKKQFSAEPSVCEGVRAGRTRHSGEFPIRSSLPAILSASLTILAFSGFLNCKRARWSCFSR